MVLLAALGAAVGHTVGNVTTPSSIGSGIGPVTVVVTPTGGVSMQTAPFSAP